MKGQIMDRKTLKSSVNLLEVLEASTVTTGPPKYWNPRAAPGPPAFSPSRSRNSGVIH